METIYDITTSHMICYQSNSKVKNDVFHLLYPELTNWSKQNLCCQTDLFSSSAFRDKNIFLIIFKVSANTNMQTKADLLRSS